MPTGVSSHEATPTFSAPCGCLPIERPGCHGCAQRIEILAEDGRAEGEHRLDGRTVLGESGGPVGVARIDEGEAQLGLVAGVAMIVEGPSGCKAVNRPPANGAAVWPSQTSGRFGESTPMPCPGSKRRCRRMVTQRARRSAVWA